jgi:hypothetical protein
MIGLLGWGSRCFGRSAQNLQSGAVIARPSHAASAAFAFCLILMTACSESQTSPTTPLNVEFTLARGESRRIEGEP